MSPGIAPPLLAPPIGGDVLSARAFARIAALAQTEFGLFLAETKKDLIAPRLQRLLQQFSHASIESLCDRLESVSDCPERAALITALTTNVTHFYREPHHFQLFTESLLKPRLDRLKRGERLRIWSAGCSSGQEPASIAMNILDLLPEADRHDIRILATDLDPMIIARARAGIYSREEIETIPPALRSRMIAAAAGEQFHLQPKLCALIHLAELNLIQSWPMRGAFDAIFCRNVAIYFDKPTQARLWQRFAQILRPGGLLFIGHSERVSGPACDTLVSAGITSYRRLDKEQS